LYMRQGKLESALSGFERYSKLHREDLKNRLKIGIIHLKQRNFSRAIQDFSDLLKDKPEYDQALYYLARTYEQQGDVDKAIVQYRLIKPGSSLWKTAQLRLALIFARRDEYATAIRVLQDALKVGKPQPELYLYMGIFYQDDNKKEKALEVLKEGLSKFPDNVDLLYRTGLVLDSLDRKEEAIKVMKKILKIEPANPEALNYIGYTYADMNIHLKEAEQLIKEALESRPKDGYILDSMAWVYYRMGNYSKALDYIQKALEFVSDDPIITEHAGDIYKAVGKTKEAIKYYKRALLLHPQKPELIEEKIKELKFSTNH
ncbi:MAG TPA: tetratricopeptide repeat protein, partial [Thermodesulforhabdus norvegica]|nr:tetratricopeptide repeat protein [Thermodesulforhabdus norvegica]